MIRATAITVVAALGLALAIIFAATPSARALQAETSTLGSATNPDGTSGAPVSTVAPSISAHGSVRVGARLSCSDGEWANDPTAYRVRWRRARRLIHTGPAYTVIRADAGYVISCYVTATNPQGSTPALGGRVTVRGRRATPGHSR